MIPPRNLSLLSNRLATAGGRRLPEAVLERDYCLAWFLVALSRTPLREHRPVDVVPQHEEERLVANGLPRAVDRAPESLRQATWARVWSTIRQRGRMVLMENRYTGVFEQVGDWWIGHAEELPGCNVQERSLEEARESLKEAIQLIVQANRELARRELDSCARARRSSWG